MLVLDEWLLTAARLAIHVPTRTAVAADLHLGYDRVRRRGGEAVPVRRIVDELAPSSDLLHRHHLQRLIIAGDLFEDGRCQREEMIEELLDWVRETGVELLGVVPGNHDRGLASSRLPVFPSGIDLGGWRIVHGDDARPAGPIVQGHEHPCLRLGPGIEGPCYMVAEGHLVLPAYSRDAAGGNVLSRPGWGSYRCCVIAGESVLDFGEVGSLRRPRR
jgi:putative SbcD/Mre11-related phosphoesterase